MASQKQLKEAEAFFKEGKALLKRTITRWSPDFDGAATKFEKAANAYRNLKMIKESYDAYKEAANAHYSAGNIYFAAKHVELAANLMRDEKKFTEAAVDYEKAANVYMEDGKIERAAELLKNTARLLADKDPANNRQKIVEMYKKSLQLFADHDGNYVSEEGYRSFNSFLIKLAMYDDAAENLKKQIDMYEDLKQPHNVYKCYLSIVIVMLAKDDWVAADESHQSYLMKRAEYEVTEEGKIATAFLKAYENNDAKLLEATQKINKIKFLENSVAQLVKKLSLNPNVKKALKKPSVTPATPNSATSPAAGKKNVNHRDALFGDMDEPAVEYIEPDDADNEEDLTGSKKPTKVDLTGSKQQPTGDDKGNDSDEDLDAFDPNNLT